MDHGNVQWTEDKINLSPALEVHKKDCLPLHVIKSKKIIY